MKKIKKFLFCLIILLILVGSIFYGGMLYQRKYNQTTITSSVIGSELKEANDLITSNYNYSRFGKYENSLELNGWSIPLTNKNFLLQYNGTIQCGLDLDQVKIDITDQTITVHTGKIKVLSHTIDEDSIQVYDEKNNLFNPIKVSDYKNFAIQEKKTALKEAKEKGLEEKAQKNAKKAIKKIIHLIPDTEQYKIVVKIGELK